VTLKASYSPKPIQGTRSAQTSLKKLQNLPEAQELRDEVEIASGYPPRRLGHRT
jgi:hypothetical protein